MDIFISQIYGKMCLSNKNEKVILLTLEPESWTVKKTSEDLQNTWLKDPEN